MRLGGPEELMEIMGNTPVILRHITAGMEEHAVQQRPGDVQWSPVEVVGHLIDVERRAIDRIDDVQRENNPVIEGVDENEMVRAAGYQDQPLSDVLSTFESLRAERLARLEALNESDWQRTFTFKGFGPVTLEEHTGHLCNHDVNHITQFIKTTG